MSIKYRKILRNLVPGDATSEKRVFPVVTYKYDNSVDLKALSKAIASKSVLGEGEVYNVLTYFSDYLHQYLLDGRVVNIDGLGFFYLSLQGKGAESVAKFTTDVITGVRICFRAHNDIRIHNGASTRTDGLHFIDVDRINDKLGAGDVPDDEVELPGTDEPDNGGSTGGNGGSGGSDTGDGSDDNQGENPLG